jgi:hypothetical protein
MQSGTAENPRHNLSADPDSECTCRKKELKVNGAGGIVQHNR